MQPDHVRAGDTAGTRSAAHTEGQLHGPLAETPDGDIHDYGDHPDHPDNRSAATTDARTPEEWFEHIEKIEAENRRLRGLADAVERDYGHGNLSLDLEEAFERFQEAASRV